LKGESVLVLNESIREVPLLTRRAIEALIAKPLLDAFSQEFGRNVVRTLAAEVIAQIARESGEQLAQVMGSRSLEAFSTLLDTWSEGGALEIEVLERTERSLSFNVTRCRYAELYEHLGMRGLGVILSCNRDFELVRGFNPAIELTRTQTIMEGAPLCDFRFVKTG
jgi:hypothetical protein